ncbi:T9SS type A sorting domain-containing protein [Kordia algicida OT-1]|uniref:Uncharacterized protein n=1 Tax=Kordia algicida OT-1 TaxID=391587 RepID=A9DX25_9FLAO|nr:T9SS type A sorting domain-containing protein [Kordia algicida]EDP95952.1 hypothetical protein KAOT1_07283 [Kordia algicida OT-1]
MKKILLALISCFCYLSANAQVAYEQNVVIDDSYGTSNPQSIHAADIDNDGFKDILVASYGEIIWRRSTDGQGNFETERRLIDDFVDAYTVRTGDFDNDGDLDVVFFMRGNGSTANVMYSENLDGAGNFAEAVALATTNSFFGLRLQVIDMNNDGDLDIIYGSTQNISWIDNTDGQANFTDNYLLANNDGFIAVDVDGDNLVDIIRDNGYDLNAYKFNADGTLGFFETMNTFALYQDYQAADIDNDGDNDILTLYINGSSKRVHWFENTDGMGTFANRQTLITLPTSSSGSANSTKGIRLVDVDNNGHLDVIVYDANQDGTTLYKNSGSLSFSNEIVINTDVPSISDVFVTDLNNDNTPDLLVTDFNFSEYFWYSNTDGLGNYSTRNPISSTALSANHVDYADIDGDGDLDLVSSSHGDNKVAWYENTDGQGNFSNLQNIISNTNEKPRNVFAVDMDGDTDNDVLFYSYLDSTTDEYQLIWIENDGSGNFTQQHIFETTMDDIIKIAYADVDDDGDMDVISGEENSTLVLYKNNGDGTFAPRIVFSQPGTSYILSLQVADVDGDDDIDILASYNNNEIIWHENTDGLGDLTTKHVIVESMHYPAAIFAADIDGDTDVDVLYANRFYDEVGYFINTDGQGTFDAPVITSEIPQNPSIIYSLDVDEDGDMDMITNSEEGQKFVWFPNDGNANFGDPVEITSFIGNISRITVADLDEDGKVDLITSIFTNEILWFKNLGAFTNTISGIVRLDANADGCDNTDAPIPSLLITTDNGENSFSTFTKADGTFMLQANKEIYTTQITSSLPNYYTSSPLSYTNDFTGLSNTNQVADFCIEANQTINDLSIVVYPSIDDPRPGFDTDYQIVYKNEGTVPLSGNISFTFDDSKVQFLSASETVATQTSNSLTFNYSGLNPFETRTINLEFNVFAPPTTNIDDILLTSATINPVAGDETEENNSFQLEQTVIGSYDPNDIRVLEGEEIFIEDADKYLHYIIRFQNTGTASAINVNVENMLDDKFDWSTIQIESLSHDGRVEITNGNQVNFIFDNINLPDSTSDEPNSHGYIAYRIKPKSNVVIGDIFLSTADIFFDFNPPITTNTASTEIVAPLSVEEFNNNQLTVYPNPTKNIVTINATQQLERVTIFDINGKLLKTVVAKNGQLQMEIPLKQFSKGIYFLKIQTNLGTQTQKIIKQ